MGWVARRAGSHLPPAVADANKVDGTSAVAPEFQLEPQSGEMPDNAAGPGPTLTQGLV